MDSEVDEDSDSDSDSGFDVFMLLFEPVVALLLETNDDCSVLVFSTGLTVFATMLVALIAIINEIMAAGGIMGGV